MNFVILVLFASGLLAQSITPSTSATVKAGSSVPLSIALTPPSGTTVSAIGWELTLPAGWTITSSATSVAMKQVFCTAPSASRCLVGGYNATAIPTGGIFTGTLNVPTVATLGLTTLSFSSTSASDPTGTGITLTPNTVAVTVTPATPSVYDLNGDGKISIADFKVLIDAYLAKTVAGDVNGDGVTDTKDFQLEVNQWVAGGSLP